jgi:hypothetical protein
MTDNIEFRCGSDVNYPEMVLYIEYMWETDDGRLWGETIDGKIYVLHDNELPTRADIRVVGGYQA